jgi:hypothetical protein
LSVGTILVAVVLVGVWLNMYYITYADGLYVGVVYTVVTLVNRRYNWKSMLGDNPSKVDVVLNTILPMFLVNWDLMQYPLLNNKTHKDKYDTNRYKVVNIMLIGIATLVEVGICWFCIGMCGEIMYKLFGGDKLAACILAIFVVVVQLLCVLFGCKYYRDKVRSKTY